MHTTDNADLCLPPDSRLYAACLGALPAAAFLKDSCGRYVFANPVWERATGKHAGEYLGKTDAEIWPATAAAEMEKADRAALESGTAVPAPWPVKGPEAWVSWRFPVPLATGEIYLGGCASRAGTAHTALDQPLRRLAQSSTIGVVYGEEDRIVEANDVFLEMLGLRREDLAGGGLAWSAITAPESHHVREEIWRELAATGVCRAKRKALLRRDGTRAEVSVGGVLLEGAPRNSWTFYVLDMAEQERLDRHRHREQAWESLGLMAAGLAHDFNNLLVVILGNASLAGAYPGCPENIQAHLGEVLTAAEEAAGLIRRLLAYSGKTRIRPVSVALAEVVRTLCAAEAHGVRLEIAMDDDLPPVKVDAAQIREALRCLLVNAVEAAGPRGVVRVRGTVCRLDDGQVLADAGLPPGEYVSVSIEDTGPGIEPRLQPRIFDPFFSTKFPGRGLGLAAAYGIVRRHAGAIRMESRPGQGSRFEILLPAPPR